MMKPALWINGATASKDFDDEAMTLDCDLVMPADHGWVEQRAYYLGDTHNSAEYQWHILHEINGLATLRDCVEVDLLRVRGVPVLRGTRFTVAQMLAELSDTSGPDEIADAFELDAQLIRNVLEGLSLLINRPFVK